MQQTPDGNALAVICFESPDPEQPIAQAARDASAFGGWFRERLKELSGIELGPAQPLQGAPELLVDCRPEHREQ